MEISTKKESIKILIKEIMNSTEEQIYRDFLIGELREVEQLKVHLKQNEFEEFKFMGPNETELKINLKIPKIKGEVYFGLDNFVDNSMHKICSNFLNGLKGTENF